MIVIKRTCLQRAILWKDAKYFVRCLGSSRGGKTTFYSVLEVDSKANQKDIKEAFLKLSKKWHPDMHISSEEVSQKQAEDNFRKVVAAYEVLSDPDKRLSYDNEIGIGKSQPFPNGPMRVHQWRPGKENMGVDPSWGRQVDVDLSEERMKKSWETYKKRWDEEEDKRKNLEEKKLHFRIYLDKRREMFDYLNDEEKDNLRESMRLFRNPRFTKDSLWNEFLDKTNGEDSYRKQDILSRKNKDHSSQKNQTSSNSNSSSTFSDRLSQEELNRRVKEESEKLQKSFESSKSKQEKPVENVESTSFESKRAMAESFWRSRIVANRDAEEEAFEKADREMMMGDFKEGAFDYEKSPEDPISFGKSNSSPLNELRDAFEASAKSSKERFDNAKKYSQERVSSPKFEPKQEFKKIFSSVKKELNEYELLSDAKYGGKNSGMRSEYKIPIFAFSILCAIFLISCVFHFVIWKEIHFIDKTAINYATQKGSKATPKPADGQ